MNRAADLHHHDLAEEAIVFEADGDGAVGRSALVVAENLPLHARPGLREMDQRKGTSNLRLDAELDAVGTAIETMHRPSGVFQDGGLYDGQLPLPEAEKAAGSAKGPAVC